MSATNVPPTVSIVTPLDNSRWHSPAGFMFQANANSGEANDSVQVQFFVNGVLQGTDTTSPYSVNLSSLAAGTYTVMARAIDGQGAQVDSVTRTVIVSDTNNPPTVSITSPTTNANYPTAPASFTLSATAGAGEVNGSVLRVEFYVNGTVVNTDTAGPFSFNVSGLANGTYVLTAKAVDQLNAETTSAPITVTVGVAPLQGYFIDTDHLNTPRLITDASQQVVWRWDNQEPFGVNVPDENPSNLGAFEFPLRFLGQYGDKETGLHYNFFRDYGPDGGRYIQSDPIGLAAGLNTYAYVGGNPLSWSDPFGLKAYQCRKPLDSMGGTGSRSGPDIWGNPAYHQYSCVVDANGKVTCGGQDRSGNPFNSPGKPTNDNYDPDRCKPTHDNKCFDDCLKEEWNKPRPRYGIPFGTDCQEYDDDINRRCRKKCGLK